VFQRFIAGIVLAFPQLIVIRTVYADAASIVFQTEEIFVWVNELTERVVLSFKKGVEDLAKFASLLREQLHEINESFMESRLNPVLIVSSDGTQDDAKQNCGNHIVVVIIQSFRVCFFGCRQLFEIGIRNLSLTKFIQKLSKLRILLLSVNL